MENTLNRKEEEWLDRHLQMHLGQRLKAHYEAMLRAALPERFRDLLGQIDDQVASGQKQENAACRKGSE